MTWRRPYELNWVRMGSMADRSGKQIFVRMNPADYELVQVARGHLPAGVDRLG